MNHVEVVAELGSNHQGSLTTALKMIDAAAEAGADAVKFQKRDNRSLYTRSYYNAPYNSENAFGPTYGDHRDALEFRKYDMRLLRVQAEAHDLKFYCTAFDLESVDFLTDVGIHGIKLASGSITNTPLLTYAAQTGLPLYVSTGACELSDVQRAVDCLSAWTPHFTLFHCTAMYPCPADKLDLGVISLYRQMFPDLTIGFSSHFNGIWPSTVAVAMGARAIEQHFTLDRSMKGTDHAFSLEPQGLKKMVRDIRRLETSLSAEKVFHEEEVPAQVKMGSTLYAARDIEAGQDLHLDDIAIKSPAGSGLPPYRLLDVIGRKLVRKLERDESITEAELLPADPNPKTLGRREPRRARP